MGGLGISSSEKTITTNCGARQRWLPKPWNFGTPSQCQRETEDLIDIFQSDKNHSYKCVSQGLAIDFAFN